MKKGLILATILTLSATTIFAKITPLEVGQAIAFHKKEVVEQYLAEGGSVHTKVGMGFPLIIATAVSGWPEGAKMLIEAGANVNDTDFSGTTPLFFAVTLNNEELVKVLVDAGADVNIKSEGITPRQLALRNGNHRIASLLVAKQGNTNSNVITTQTILSTLSEADQQKAQMEADKGKSVMYDLYEKGQSFLEFVAGAKNPLRLGLITPYSQFRHGFYKEKQTFVPFTAEEKKAIIESKDFVYIVPYSMYDLSSRIGATRISNIVIRKNGTIYYGDPVGNAYLSGNFVVSEYYAFPINLFDGEPMEIIAIDAQTDKQLVMKIDRKFYQKRGWY